MDNFLTSSLELLSAGNYIAAFWSFVLVLLSSVAAGVLPLLFSHMFNRRHRKLSQSAEWMNGGCFDERLEKGIRERLAQEAFRQCCGIVASPVMRNALLDFHDAHSDQVSWVNIRRAYPFMYLNGAWPGIRIRWWNKVLYWIVTSISIVIWLYSLAIVAMTFILNLPQVDQVVETLALYLLAILNALAGMVFSSLGWPYRDARKIKRLLAETPAVG